jgi:DNA ligase (NAD+)
MNQKDLENQYLLAKQKYYEGDPIMSDYEFDLLEENLKSLNSQVIKIVGSSNLKDAKFNHVSPMLSLSKIQVHHKTEFPTIPFLSWYDSNKISDCLLEATPKFDGSSCNLIYENGQLQWALTRGDKTKGQNIIDKMKLIVPKTINIQDKAEIRGEVVIPTDIFNQKYGSIYKNPRNFVAGILGRDEIDQEIIQDFHFVAFECRIHNSKEHYHHSQTFPFLKENGFIPSPIVLYFKASDFRETYNTFADFRKKSPYQLDGIVIKFPENQRNQIGETGHHPKWAMAIKFPPLEAITTIKDIAWSTGISGEFNPVGQLEPIELDGTTVSNVSLHNYGNVIQKGLFPGAKVIIVKSGDIIPIVQKIIEPKFDDIEKYIPTQCTTPECKIEVQNEIHLVCTNPNCINRKLHRLGRGIGSFGFRNVAGSMIKKLYQAGFESVLDIFDNSKFNEENLIKSGEFKKGRQLEILMQSRNNPTNKITLPIVVNALAFDNVGWSTAVQISKLFEGKQPNFTGLNHAAYSPFLNPNSEEYKLVNRFIEILNSNGFEIQLDEQPIITKDTIKYEMTGSPKSFGFKTKEEFQNLIKANGYLHTGLDKSTNVLITDDINSSSSKMAKAKKLGVEIKTYDQILEEIKNK